MLVRKRAQVGLCFHDLDDFTAFVFSTVRASTMGANLFVAVRTFGELRYAQRVVRASGRCPAFGMASFRIRHEFLNSLIDYLIYFYDHWPAQFWPPTSVFKLRNLLQRSSIASSWQPQSV